MKKIAVPVDINNQIEDHFGHCDHYEILTISNENKIVKIQTLETVQGCGCKSNISSVLFDSRVTLILADAIGASVINVLNNSGIQVILGCSGNAQVIVKQFVQEKISDSGVSCLQHKHHNRDGQDQKCNY